jgi:DNA-binding NarL/FixJ family response regulator
MGMRLALQGEVDICAEADNAEQAIRAAKREQPDVCLIAWELPGDGLAAVRGVTRAAPDTAVIVLSDTADADVMLDVIKAGAVGYVPGGVSPERLRKIISAVDSREAVLPRGMVLDLLLELRAVGSEADGLTVREAQVLGMLRRGHSTAAIAKRLDIAPVPVRRHISELVRKLGVEDRTELLSGGSGRWLSSISPASPAVA